MGWVTVIGALVMIVELRIILVAHDVFGSFLLKNTKRIVNDGGIARSRHRLGEFLGCTHGSASDPTQPVNCRDGT